MPKMPKVPERQNPNHENTKLKKPLGFGQCYAVFNSLLYALCYPLPSVGPGPPIDLGPNPEAIKPQRLEEHDQHHDQAIEDELDVGDPGDGKIAF